MYITRTCLHDEMNDKLTKMIFNKLTNKYDDMYNETQMGMVKCKYLMVL